MYIMSGSERETEEAGAEFAASLKAGDVVAFYGGLGMGKTAFVRGMAKGLGVSSRVSSPTFTLVNEYEGVIPLFHFDMYRIRSADELVEIGWEDYLQRGGICAVEWSENVPGAFPEDRIKVEFTRTGDESRMIRISRAGEEG